TTRYSLPNVSAARIQPALGDFTHFNVGYIFVFKHIFRRGGATALFPVGFDAEGAALDASDDVQYANGNGCGNHEDYRHGHAEKGKEKEEDASDNLVKCIHMAYVDSSRGKKFP